MAKKIPNPAEEASVWNGGWRLGVVWGSATVLVAIIGGAAFIACSVAGLR